MFTQERRQLAVELPLHIHFVSYESQRGLHVTMDVYHTMRLNIITLKKPVLTRFGRIQPQYLHVFHKICN